MEKVLKFVPENQILLETDTIEESIYQVYEKAAAVKNLHLNEIGGVLNEKRDHF